MEKYILLLRGINVGGKNKVSMSELKLHLENIGFHEVITYINSGNIIFSSDINDENVLKAKCEACILDKFQLAIPVLIVSIKDLSAALCNAPPWWDEDETSKHNAIFILPPTSGEDVFKAICATKPEYEKVDHYDRVVFWSMPIETYSVTRLSKVVRSNLRDRITIRNANTVKKLVQLATKREGVR